MERAWATVFEQTEFVKPLVCESALLPCISELQSSYDGVSVPAGTASASCISTMAEQPSCCAGLPVCDRWQQADVLGR